MTHTRKIFAAAGTTLAVGTLVALLGAPATGAPMPAAQASSRSATTTRVNVPFTGGKQGQADIGAKGFSAGDMFTFIGMPLRDDVTGQRLGALDGIETVVARGHNGTVSQLYTVRLAQGTLTVAGVLRHTDPHPALAILGGTGAYAGARGQLVVLREDNTRKKTVFNLEILP